MTEKELRRLSRVELLEMLLQMSREQDALKEQLADREAALADRHYKLEQAGSIAEVSAQLNGLFETAQKTADDYVQNARELADRQMEAEKAELAKAKEALAAEQAQLEQTKESLAAERTRLEQAKASFATEQEKLAGEKAALAAEKEQLTQERNGGHE